MVELKKYFDYILNNYLLPENNIFSSQMEYYKVIVNRIPEEISKLYDNQKYKIYGSCGKGTKSASPYIAICDRKITTSTQRGIYVDFIFKSDMTGIYLTIDQGITSIREKYGNKKSKENAQQAAELFRSMISDLKGFESGLVSGHTKSGSLEEGYENTRVIAKCYDINSYTNEEIINDLKSIMSIYEEIIEKMSGQSYDEIIEGLNENSSNKKIQYWTYSAGENASEWDYCTKNNKMVIGWDELGNLLRIKSRDELRNKMAEIYGKDNSYNNISACDDFLNKMRIGDIIIAKIGQKTLLGYGVVTGEYYFDDNKAAYKHTRNVEWKKEGRWEIPDELRVARKTLTDITPYEGFAQKLLKIIDGGEKMKELYKEWLLSKGFAESSVSMYTSSIALTSSEGIEDGILKGSIYEIDNVDELDKVISILNTNERFNNRKINSNNINTASLNNYRRFLEENSLHLEEEKATGSYTKDSFLKEVFISSDKYDSIVSVLERKKNIILEGAPGVGKTFIAKRLAYSLIGNEDDSKIKVIQFHQNYSYEDFIEGYRPTENGFKLEKGIFYNFCEQAKNDPNNNYYMIIDEINRGNLSKIFGELLMLIENDKRGNKYKLTLAYSKEDFYVPENLFIIGLMNTADRSLALIDYALRRRFSFIRIEPAFDNEKFIEAFNKKFDEQYNTIIEIIKSINNDIEQDKSLGSGFEIGHSYFLPKLKDGKGNKKDLEDIIRFEIIPLLEEYWYDDEETLIKWKDNLFGYFK